MRFSISFVLLLLLSVSSKALCAETLVLNIKPQSQYFETDTTLTFDFITTLPVSNFRIRPLVIKGVCYIYYSENIYNSCSDMWTKMPLISNSLNIRLTATASHVYLAFQIQNISTGKITETNKVLFINKSLVETYLSKVNANIINVGIK